MEISGSGITGFDFRVADNYSINTVLGMKWFQCADGNWYASDRGYRSDYYEATIKTFGYETYINNILTQVNNNRTNANFVILMSNFADDEHIFGEDIDYTGTVSGTIIDIGQRQQNSWKGFANEFSIRCLSPSFSGTPSLPTWASSCVAIGYNNQQIYTNNKYDTYYGAFSYYDHDDDSGKITFTLNLTNAELANLRTWVRTNRDSTFNLTDLNGVDTIIPNMTYPMTMKILEVQELNRFNINRYLVAVTLATHIIN
jgi:hypothetical protein